MLIDQMLKLNKCKTNATLYILRVALKTIYTAVYDVYIYVCKVCVVKQIHHFIVGGLKIKDKYWTVMCTDIFGQTFSMHIILAFTDRQL